MGTFLRAELHASRIKLGSNAAAAILGPDEGLIRVAEAALELHPKGLRMRRCAMRIPDIAHRKSILRYADAYVAAAKRPRRLPAMELERTVLAPRQHLRLGEHRISQPRIPLGNRRGVVPGTHEHMAEINPDPALERAKDPRRERWLCRHCPSVADSVRM